MNEQDGSQYSLFADLPHLSEDERDDARFLAKDLAWSVLAGAFDSYAEEDQTLTYKALGDRIGRSRSQVQRWLDSPHNMTLQSMSLLAEGLNADLVIKILRRRAAILTNGCHPADEAQANSGVRLYKAKVAYDPTNLSGKVRSWGE